MCYLYLLFGSTNITNAQGKNFSVSKTEPSWIVNIALNGSKPKEKDIQDGYFLALYEEQNHAELKEEYVRMIREIVSDAGVQNGSQISVSYDPSFQKLLFHKLILWRNGKPTDLLPGIRFKVLQQEKELSRFIYSGVFNAFLLLEDVRKGDRIEYSYTKKGNNPIFGEKLASLYYLEGPSSIGQLYTNIICSPQRDIRIKAFSGAPEPKISFKGNDKLYEWSSQQTHTHRTADFEPTWYNPFSRVQLTEYKNWNEVVDWGISISDYSLAATPQLDKKIAELKAESKNDQQRYIELAKRFVQDEIRYMGIEMGVYSHRPNSPEKIMKHRYGDCKDKSLLLVQLLKAAGVNAFLVYANTESTLKTNESLPSPFVFDHVIVLIEHGGKKYWIDPTISYQRGRLPDFYAPDYGYVLVLKPGVNQLEKMNSPQKGKLKANLVFNVADTTDNQKTTLAITSTYTHNYADNIRSAIAESGTEGLQKDYLEYYAKYYSDIQSTEPIEISDDELSNTLTLTEHYVIENIWTHETDGSSPNVTFFGDMVSTELRKISLKNRKEPLAMKYPVNIEQEITAYMPWTFSDYSDSAEVSGKAYQFRFKRSNSTNTVFFHYQFSTLKSYLENEEISNYVKDYKKINEQLSYYFSANARDSNAITSSETKNPAIAAFILILLLSAAFSVWVYTRRESYDITDISNARRIGGWLILLAVRIVCGPIAFLGKALQLNLFKADFWTGLSSAGPVKGIVLKFGYAINLAGYAFLTGTAVLAMILFFSRRKSFIAFYLQFCYLVIAVNIITFVLGVTNLTSVVDVRYNIGFQFGAVLTSLIITVVIILYLRKSVRVKQTFVFTYPSSEWALTMVRHYNQKLTGQTNVNRQDELALDNLAEVVLTAEASEDKLLKNALTSVDDPAKAKHENQSQNENV